MLLTEETDGMGEKTMSSSRTLHVLNRGCVLATVLALASVLPGCTQLTSKADSVWTITGLTQKLAALEILPASNTLANVVQAVLPSGYQVTYADGIDINQPADRPAAELSWNDQVKSIAAAGGLAVRVDGKRVYFEKDVAAVTSATVPPKLVDATIMGMPRSGRHHPEAPAPLMTPQEAALLEKAQVSASAPALIPVSASTEATAQPSAAVLAPETVPLVIITEEPTSATAVSPTPPAVETGVADKPIALTPVTSTPVESQKVPVVQEAEKSVPVLPAPSVGETSVQSSGAAVPQETAPVSPRLANITVMGTPKGSELRSGNVVRSAAVSSPVSMVSSASPLKADAPVVAAASAPVANASSSTPPEGEAVVLTQALTEPVKAAEPVVPASEPVKSAAESFLVPAPSESEKVAPAAGGGDAAPVVAGHPAEAPAVMVPSTPEEHAVASVAPTAPDLSAAVGSNFDTSKGRPVAAIGAWSAERGQTLHEVLQGWCERANVELNWSSNYDFPLKASVSIDDTFENAVRTLLTGFSGASPQPVGRLHRQANAGSRLLVIETRGNRYED